MLQPDQFYVNEAWIAFKLNDHAIRTETDGDLDFIALMDAASCFIVSSAVVRALEAEPTTMESKRLLKQGRVHKNELPKTLFIPTKQPAQYLTLEAERQGITVVRIPEDQLLLFIGEARECFREGLKERFGSVG